MIKRDIPELLLLLLDFEDIVLRVVADHRDHVQLLPRLSPKGLWMVRHGSVGW